MYNGSFMAFQSEARYQGFSDQKARYKHANTESFLECLFFFLKQLSSLNNFPILPFLPCWKFNFCLGKQRVERRLLLPIPLRTAASPERRLKWLTCQKDMRDALRSPDGLCTASRCSIVMYDDVLTSFGSLCNFLKKRIFWKGYLTEVYILKDLC